MALTQNVDIEGLVDRGLLDLDEVFEYADWAEDGEIATFTACCYGDGSRPGEVDVVLESAQEYGITAYRWAERDPSGRVECGDITLDRAKAVSDGEEYAALSDEEPDTAELVRKIVDTGFFGNADAADILAICEEATGHTQGYLLLPTGQFVGHPISRMWTTNGYLQCDHITLDATHSRVSYAADALLRAVTAE